MTLSYNRKNYLPTMPAYLVTDWAVEWVVDQEELHDAFPSLLRHVRVGFDVPALHHWHGTGGHRLGRQPTVNGGARI